MEAGATLRVTVTPAVPAAAELRNTLPLASRCWPTVNKLFIAKVFCSTVAVTVADVYPVALAVMLAVPTPTALNVVDAEEAPPAITTGEEPMVPTARRIAGHCSAHGLVARHRFKYAAAAGERRCIHVQCRREAVQRHAEASESAARRLNEQIRMARAASSVRACRSPGRIWCTR